jgi:2-polyprenyl-3-methyl-5-hydroxy-6-metoxy-1,4-benzoquinol methylase
MSEWNFLDKYIAKKRYRIVKKYIGINNTICDIGCGKEATFLNSVSEYSKKCIGMDKCIEESTNDKITLLNCNLTNGFNIKDQNVDIITALALIEHLEDCDNFLQTVNENIEVYKTIVLTTPTKVAKPILEFMAFKLKIINKDEILEHKHYYNKKELISLLTKNGFKIIKHKYFEFGFNQLIVAKKVKNIYE